MPKKVDCNLKLSDLKSSKLSKERIKTDIVPFDSIINGGFETTGTIVQIISSSGLGKSSITCQICLALCNKGFNILYVDTEGSVGLDLLSSVGLIDYLDNHFFYVRESSFSKVEQVMDQFISTNEIQFIVIDSLANLMHDGFDDLSLNKNKPIKDENKKEKNGAISITTNNSNYNSRQLTLFLNKYSMISKEKKISMIYINQFRTRITNLFNYAEEKIGGSKNVKYNSDIIIKISNNISTENKDFKTFVNKESEDKIGRDLEFEIIKSNQSRPGRKIPFRLIFGKGISNKYCGFYALYKLGLITKSSSTYYYTKNGLQKKYSGKDDLLAKYEDWYDASYEEITNFYNNIK